MAESRPSVGFAAVKRSESWNEAPANWGGDGWTSKSASSSNPAAKNYKEAAKGGILVRMANGTSASFMAEPDTTVADFKAKIVERFSSVSVDSFNLFFGSKQLDDDRTLGDYGIKNGSLVYYIRRLRGGRRRTRRHRNRKQRSRRST